MALTHKGRLEKVLAGEKPDRPATALWRHFPVDDMRAETLADAHLHFQQTYDWDLIKVTPPSGYFLYDWGVQDVWRGNTEGTREYIQRAIQWPEDWGNLPVLDPRSGFLGEQLAGLNKIIDAAGTDTPVLETIFNPLSQAKKLVGDDNLLVHLKEYPENVMSGLEIIVESTRLFMAEAIKLGVSGFFFAVQHAQQNMLPEEDYVQFGRESDLACLDAARGTWLNILHLHGEDVYFDLLADYPVQVVNWHDLETPPNLSEGKERFDGVVCGGLRQWVTLALGTAEDVETEVRNAIEATEGERFILGTGCVTPIITPHSNLLAVNNACRSL